MFNSSRGYHMTIEKLTVKDMMSAPPCEICKSEPSGYLVAAETVQIIGENCKRKLDEKEN